MKNTIYLVFVSFLFVSCSDTKKEIETTVDNTKTELVNTIDYDIDDYVYTYGDVLPDSSRKDMAKWITETVKSASQQMTGGDYEDPEDLIEQCEETGLRLFQVRVEGLNIRKKSNGYFEFVPKYELTQKQLLIFNDLKNKQ